MLAFTSLGTPSTQGCNIYLLYRKSRDQVGGPAHSQQHLPLPLPFPATLTFIQVGALLANTGPRTDEPQTSPAVWRLVGLGSGIGSSTSHKKLYNHFSVHPFVFNHLFIYLYPVICPPVQIYTPLSTVFSPSFHLSTSSSMFIHLLG